MMMKTYAIEIIFKSHEPFQSYQLSNWPGLTSLSGRIFCVLPGTRNLQCLVCQLLYSSFFLLRTFFSWPLKHTAWPFWPLKIQKDTSTIFQLPSHFFATVLTILLYIHFQRFCSEYLRPRVSRT